MSFLQPPTDKVCDVKDPSGPPQRSKAKGSTGAEIEQIKGSVAIEHPSQFEQVKAWIDFKSEHTNSNFKKEWKVEKSALPVKHQK